jgi:hypothetical protein
VVLKKSYFSVCISGKSNGLLEMAILEKVKKILDEQQ